MGLMTVVEIVFAMIIVIFLMNAVLPRILNQEGIDTGPETKTVESWTKLIIPELKESSKNPKQASTDWISFSTTKDNRILGYELASELKTYLELERTPICCDCTAQEGDWRICNVTSCSQTEKVIEIVNDDGAVFEEKPYKITVKADTNFEWLCIIVESGGES